MPRNPTPAQSAAARANGARSTGPVTPEGRARSARNATGPGLRAAGFTLRDDEVPLFDALHEAFRRRYRPADAGLAEQVAELARNALLHRRLDELEMLVMTSAVGFAWMEPEELAEAAKPRLPSLATLCRYRARLERRDGELRAQLAEAAEAAEAAVTAPPAVRPAASRTNEPEQGPAVAPPPPLNRHERRRREALARQRAKAA